MQIRYPAPLSKGAAFCLCIVIIRNKTLCVLAFVLDSGSALAVARWSGMTQNQQIGKQGLRVFHIRKSPLSLTLSPWGRGTSGQGGNCQGGRLSHQTQQLLGHLVGLGGNPHSGLQQGLVFVEVAGFRSKVHIHKLTVGRVAVFNHRG